MPVHKKVGFATSFADGVFDLFLHRILTRKVTTPNGIRVKIYDLARNRALSEQYMCLLKKVQSELWFMEIFRDYPKNWRVAETKLGPDVLYFIYYSGSETALREHLRNGEAAEAFNRAEDLIIGDRKFKHHSEVFGLAKKAVQQKVTLGIAVLITPEEKTNDC